MSTTIRVWDAESDLPEDLQDQISDMVYRLFLGSKSSFMNSQLLNKVEDVIIERINLDIPTVLTEMSDMDRPSLITEATLTGLSKDNGKISGSMQILTSEGIEKDVRIEL
jgi:hypothetical protein